MLFHNGIFYDSCKTVRWLNLHLRGAALNYYSCCSSVGAHRSLSMGKKRQQSKWRGKKQKSRTHRDLFKSAKHFFFLPVWSVKTRAELQANYREKEAGQKKTRGGTERKEVALKKRTSTVNWLQTIMLSWSIHRVFYAFCMCYFIIMYYQIKLVAMATYQLFNCEHQCSFGGPLFTYFLILKWRRRRKVEADENSPDPRWLFRTGPGCSSTGGAEPETKAACRSPSTRWSKWKPVRYET